jgi:acetyl-CoA C-acetyltransferase
VLGALDDLEVVYCQSWQYDDAPQRLADRLGIAPRRQHYSGIGGTTPQQLVDGIAAAMLAGDLDLAVVTGAEALATKRRIKKDGRRPEWSHPPDEKRPFPFEAPFLPSEIAHEVFQATLTFPVWDIARRAARGASPGAYRAEIGELLAPMTAVAAANPHAWFPVERSAVELSEPSADNRLVGYPYTKYEVAVMDVDMAAALVVATHAAADRLGVPADRRVYLRGWCYATDAVHLAEHQAYTSSPAMAAASAEAMRVAGVGIDDVAHLDLYSCFASSLHFAQDALGLAPDDARSLTVTGGLPFAGGPASNYLTHALSSMTDVLRDAPGALGMVSGVGMHMTKHVYALYSTDPPTGLVPPDEQAVQASLDAAGVRTITETATGPATVVTYTVAHGRDGRPDWGLALCDLPDGTRCHARVEDEGLLAEIESREWVGADVELVAGDGDRNLVKT